MKTHNIVKRLYHDNSLELKILTKRRWDEETKCLFIVSYDDLGYYSELDQIDTGTEEYLEGLKKLIESGIEKVARMECTIDDVNKDLVLYTSNKSI